MQTSNFFPRLRAQLCSLKDALLIAVPCIFDLAATVLVRLSIAEARIFLDQLPNGHTSFMAADARPWQLIDFKHTCEPGWTEIRVPLAQ